VQQLGLIIENENHIEKFFFFPLCKLFAGRAYLTSIFVILEKEVVLFEIPVRDKLGSKVYTDQG
jgi:hypothetical protein